MTNDAVTWKAVSRRLRAPLHRRAALRRLREFHAGAPDLGAAVDLALDFGGAGWYRVKTLQVRSEILALAEAVRALRPATVLEIGTSHGGTLFIWAQLATERIVTCDLEDRPGREALYAAFPPPASACTIRALHGDTHDAAFRRRVIAALEDRPVDFLFIDGDHTAPGVAADYRDYGPLVRPGGLIAFHDIVERQVLATNQVYRFWEGLKREVKTEEFVHDPRQTGYGIGVVHVAKAVAP